MDSPDIAAVDKIVVEGGRKDIGRKAGDEEAKKRVELGNGNEDVGVEGRHATRNLVHLFPTNAHDEVIHFTVADQDTSLDVFEVDLVDVVSSSNRASDDDESVACQDVDAFATSTQDDEHDEAEEGEEESDDNQR